MTDDGALSTVRVIEVSHSDSSVPVAGRILADFGADVLVLDWPNRRSRERTDSGLRHSCAGKTVQPVDLGDALQAASFREKLAHSSVLLVDKDGLQYISECGLSADKLSALLPHLVICCMSAFGVHGEPEGFEENEVIVQALTGMMLCNGYPDDPPIAAGIPIAKLGGALLGVAAALAAVYECHMSGKGQFIDQAQYDSLIVFLGTLLPRYFLTGEDAQRIGNRHPMSAPWNSYRSRDGWIVINTVNESQWARLTEALGMPWLVSDERFTSVVSRCEHVDELDQIIETWASRRTTADALAELASSDVIAGPVLTLEEAINDPQTAERGLVVVEGNDMRLGSLLRIEALSTNGRLASGPGSHKASESSDPTLLDPRKERALAPLAGIRVVEVGSLTAAPLAGCFLGMLGAEVIKVEPPKGESARHLAHRVGDSSYLYIMNNTDKYSCVLSLENPDDQLRFYRLIESADVFLSNIASGTLSAWGLSCEDLLQSNPRIIYCSITGYGLTGSNRNRKAFDTVIQALSGIMALTGLPDGPPMKVGASVVDLLGAYASLVGMLIALQARLWTDQAQLVDVALHDVAVWSTHERWGAIQGAAESLVRQRSSTNRGGQRVLNDALRAADGYVAIGLDTDEQWNDLLEVVGKGEMRPIGLGNKVAEQATEYEKLESVIREWTRLHTVEEIAEQLRRLGVPAAKPLRLSEVATSPLTAVRKMVITKDIPGSGLVQLIGSPFKFSRSHVTRTRPAPRLGQDNHVFLENRSVPASADQRGSVLRSDD